MSQALVCVPWSFNPTINNSPHHSLKEKLARSCQVSNLAVQGGDPKNNKNYRNNPSFLIHHLNDDDDENDTNSYKNIINY
jgi:hypothetical protein